LGVSFEIAHNGYAVRREAFKEFIEEIHVVERERWKYDRK